MTFKKMVGHKEHFSKMAVRRNKNAFKFVLQLLILSKKQVLVLRMWFGVFPRTLSYYREAWNKHDKLVDFSCFFDQVFHAKTRTKWAWNHVKVKVWKPAEASKVWGLFKILKKIPPCPRLPKFPLPALADVSRLLSASRLNFTLG